MHGSLIILSPINKVGTLVLRYDEIKLHKDPSEVISQYERVSLWKYSKRNIITLELLLEIVELSA